MNECGRFLISHLYLALESIIVDIFFLQGFDFLIMFTSGQYCNCLHFLSKRQLIRGGGTIEGAVL